MSGKHLDINSARVLAVAILNPAARTAALRCSNRDFPHKNIIAFIVFESVLFNAFYDRLIHTQPICVLFAKPPVAIVALIPETQLNIISTRTKGKASHI